MRSRWLLPLLALLATAHPARAQTPDTTSCTWDTCALRIRAATLTEPQTLVRGRQEDVVVQLGLFKPPITPHLARSSEAVSYGRLYDSLYDRGSILSIIGTVISIGAPIMAETTGRKIAFTAVGIGLSVWGGVIMNDANDALSQAVWWHNRALINP